MGMRNTFIRSLLTNLNSGKSQITTFSGKTFELHDKEHAWEAKKVAVCEIL